MSNPEGYEPRSGSASDDGRNDGIELTALNGARGNLSPKGVGILTCSAAALTITSLVASEYLTRRAYDELDRNTEICDDRLRTKHDEINSLEAYSRYERSKYDVLLSKVHTALSNDTDQAATIAEINRIIAEFEGEAIYVPSTRSNVGEGDSIVAEDKGS
ncbi:uncharacterized protein IL334_001304 [Kwoniella shivajii]|uniref:SMODS and SLOG-associating 2TM effector domain-containing protein n=1 Tax=Kwoniella shivajii TaxID=564305 RepID=A0ABZ1CRI9_9TREE|nr:hypothetical protein IL334_001304 [Kwoniella shivajii]